jgi:hypothetical protein
MQKYKINAKNKWESERGKNWQSERSPERENLHKEMGT